MTIQNAHLVVPPTPKGRIVVVHENRGLEDHIRDVANRFAALGYAVAAPDYLAPVGGSSADFDDNIDRLKGVTRDDVASITAHWLDVLSGVAPETKSAVLGFCWGGGVVNHCATILRDMTAGVMFYGTAPAAEQIPHIKASLQLHYAENDERINAGRDAYLAALSDAGVSHQAHIYAGAGHAFFNDTRADRHHAPSAALAFERVTAFLKEQLG
jgi:carboxymethylenebutenolidase